MITTYNENCVRGLCKVADRSVQLVLADPPYGTTKCRWDKPLPMDLIWSQLARILKPDGAVVLFCQQPFTSSLIMGNLPWFKYMWYWRKSRPSGYTNAKLKPLKDVEEIAVFSPASTANGARLNMKYRPQGLTRVDKEWSRPRKYGDGTGVNTTRPSHQLSRTIEYEGYPRQVLDYSNSNDQLLHPAQKPVPLCDYLIRTYTDEGDTVLDFCAGSGSTGVAAKSLSRDFIGFEIDPDYYTVLTSRLACDTI